MSCLTCQEIEEQICQLVTELAGAEPCLGQVRQEGGVTIDQSGQLKAKQSALTALKELYKLKKCESSDSLYEFLHVPCVTVTSCGDDSCGGNRVTLRTPRRYRR